MIVVAAGALTRKNRTNAVVISLEKRNVATLAKTTVKPFAAPRKENDGHEGTGST